MTTPASEDREQASWIIRRTKHPQRNLLQDRELSMYERGIAAVVAETIRNGPLSSAGLVRPEAR